MKRIKWVAILMVAAATVHGEISGIGGYCAAVEVDGTNAFLGAGQILLVLDVSNPAAPICSDSLYLPGRIEDIAVSGTNLYAACGDAGVHRVDVSNPWNTHLLDTYDSPGHAYGLAANSNTLYLADGVGGLQVLNAVSLSVTDSYTTNGPAMDVAVSGSAIYLLDHFNGVIALNTSLAETGVYGLIGFGNRLALDGSTLYVTDGNGNVSEINTAGMTLTDSTRIGPPTIGVAVTGSDVFVANGDAGVQLLGGTPVDTPGNATDIAVADSKLYIADGFGGLQIFDASTSVRLGSYSAVARSRQTAVDGGYAYVAAGNQGVKIFNVADPSSPALVATASSSSNAQGVAVSGNLLCVADGVYGLELIDISFPASPAHVGKYANPSPAVVHCVGAVGTSAYISDGYTVRKIDVSTPSVPALQASYNSPDYIFGLAAVGTNVLLAVGNGGLVALSDELKLDGSAALPGLTMTISVDGDYAFGSGPADWNLVDVSSPLTPVAVTNIAPLVRAMQLTASGITLYASADDGGTAILMLPALQTDADVDGLDDTIEQQIIDADPDDEFTDLASVLPDDDFDGDGLSNLHEQIAGTSAIDPDSVFAINNFTENEGGFAVSWHSVAGHTYTIHKSTNLKDGFKILKAGISADEPVNTYVDSASGQCAMYLISVD